MLFPLFYLSIIFLVSHGYADQYANKIKEISYPLVFFVPKKTEIRLYRPKVEKDGILTTYEDMLKSAYSLPEGVVVPISGLYVVTRDYTANPGLLGDLQQVFAKNDIDGFFKALAKIVPSDHKLSGYLEIEHLGQLGYLKLADLNTQTIEFDLEQQKIKILQSIALYKVKQWIDLAFDLQGNEQKNRNALNQITFNFFCNHQDCQINNVGNLVSLMNDLMNIIQIEADLFDFDDNAGQRIYYRKQLCLLSKFMNACSDQRLEKVNALIKKEQKVSTQFSCSRVASFLLPVQELDEQNETKIRAN